jgi:uncharacterized membrane protein
MFTSRFGESAGHKVGRWVFAALCVTAGTLHFVIPATYLRIMPPLLPYPLALVWISGGAEIAGGLGLLLRPVRKAAAWGLIALLVAVSPANVYMAMIHLPLPGVFGQSWAQWLRVPLQLPLIAWAWLYTRARASDTSSQNV